MKNPIDVLTIRAKFHYDEQTGHLFRRLKNGKLSNKPAGRMEDGYRIVSFAYQDWRASHLVWLHVTGKLPENVIDHKNGVRDDNRFENLRDTTLSMNAQNRNGPNRNRLVDLPLGIYPAGRRFLAQFTVDGVKHTVGTFDTVDQAQNEYLKQRRLFCPGNTL